MKISLILSALAITIAMAKTGVAQVGIGTDNPSHKAILHVESSDKGLIIPTMNTSQIDAMTVGTPPDQGTMVYNSDSNEVYVFFNAKWNSLTPLKKEHNQLTTNKGKIVALANTVEVRRVNATTVNATNGNGIVPIGGIIMWSGASVPAGWALCDGNNSTPDLRDKFVVGSGSSYSIGNTGGANSVALSTGHLPSHQHSGTTNWDGAHTHGPHITARADNDDNDTPHNFLTYDGANYYYNTITIKSAGSDHSHNFTSNNCIGCYGTAHENRPPYYALAFIMRKQ
jgi:microcystin-dependent protein